MNANIIKLALAAAFVVLVYVGGRAASNRAGIHRPIRLPEQSISTIPMELGTWKGEDVPVEEKLFRGGGAHEIVSRSYTNPLTGQELTLHCALFNQFWRIVPHTPMRCYPMNGWATMSTEDFELSASDGTSAMARLACFEKGGGRTFVLFWFQFGDFVICGDSDLNRVRDEYRNEETWPSIVKVMIQTSAEKPEQAKAQLRDFANALYDVTRKFK